MSQHVIKLIYIIYISNLIQAASLQNYNTELVKSLEGIRERRENLLIDMKKDNDEKMEINQNMDKLSQELEELNMNLQYKENLKKEFDKVISNTEKAYYKLLEGSQTLLAILQRDEASLEQKMGENDN